MTSLTERLQGLPPGWATDLAALRMSGSTIADLGDHLVVRTPGVPTYHWGNCIFALDAAGVDDAGRWVAAFEAAVPGADWIAVGLVRPPAATAAWEALGVEVEHDDVLSTRTLPRPMPLAHGYVVRALAGDDDWEQVVRRGMDENALTDGYEPAGHEIFLRGRTAQQRALCESGRAAWFGAFAGDELVADLGIVDCDGTARYQAVGTAAAHRRRGLCAHLLGVAARWAAARGCRRFVIVTEATNPAGRVYRSVGFAPDAGNAQAYRRPSR